MSGGAASASAHPTAMRRLLRENGLSLTLLVLFLLSLIGQAISGHWNENEERIRDGEPPRSISRYLASGGFAESVFENWESEFLQMSMYVVLTISLRQKGSAESKPMAGDQPVDEDPRLARTRRRVPWPVRRGGWVLRVYEHSLGLALGLLFLVSIVAHAFGGAYAAAEEKGEVVTGAVAAALRYAGTSRFWFESFQNWQSEFLSVAVLVLLSIYLRQRGSPESKPVASPHDETGG